MPRTTYNPWIEQIGKRCTGKSCRHWLVLLFVQWDMKNWYCKALNFSLLPIAPISTFLTALRLMKVIIQVLSGLYTQPYRMKSKAPLYLFNHQNIAVSRQLPAYDQIGQTYSTRPSRWKENTHTHNTTRSNKTRLKQDVRENKPNVSPLIVQKRQNRCRVDKAQEFRRRGTKSIASANHA